jgi:hypothetical protein
MVKNNFNNDEKKIKKKGDQTSHSNGNANENTENTDEYLEE